MMYKCKVCEKEFELKIETHYVCRDNQPTGLSVLVGSKEYNIYDAFNCPFCGCQNVVNQRKRTLRYEEIQQEIEEESEEYEPYEEEEEYDEYDECEVNEKESHVKKKSKKPKCFGNYEKSNEECDCFCNCKFECKKVKKQNAE